MLLFLPATLVFLLQCYLLFSWFKAFRQNEGRAKAICFWGFLLGQLYLLWEVALVRLTGKPLPGTPEQKLLMSRVLLGGSLGGLFILIGLFYLSFSTYRQRQKTGADRSSNEASDH